MREATTDVIVSRSRDADRLSSMLVWSIGAHIAITAFVLFGPHPRPAVEPKNIMMISLGGAPGPKTQGMTQMGGRTVQAPPPVEPVKKAESAPAPKTPAMTLPDPRSKPVPPVKKAPRDATAKTPTTGAEPQEGTARSETRIRGQGFGLSTGGGGGGGVTVDAVDFCCPDYIITMQDLVRQNWNSKQGIIGVTTMKFTIRKDGAIEGVQLEKSSGFAVLDTEAARALRLARLPPLPTRYPNQMLTIHLEFAYER
jgi:TonB family protein